MEYKVFGTMVFNVSMVVDASSEDEAEQLAMDRMDEGTLDSFTLGESANDNEVCETQLVKD